MDDLKIRELVKRLDTASVVEQEAAWTLLRPLGAGVVPFLADAYGSTKKAQGRVALIFHAIRFARDSEAAFELGIRALKDKATLVRYRACGVCAYSLRPDAIPHLEELLEHPDAKTAEDAVAAIDAIKRKNHHYFIDRSHSGTSFWTVNPEDSAV
ncbi:hypothetical protein GTP23_21685 [Pseudoduganella sp. FT93W]|uniref:HEAT repeat domain-containing protein n=1 Tax=Duganella fentianensis TaxID=2692177 RepID=A0A845I2X4_9BURK|nr:hypothetical protein [Duganella fentianensis]MYN47653.1 hypothetical protein [Duganella fentianensis]